jgi:hypothetical protein
MQFINKANAEQNQTKVSAINCAAMRRVVKMVYSVFAFGSRHTFNNVTLRSLDLAAIANQGQPVPDTI